MLWLIIAIISIIVGIFFGVLENDGETGFAFMVGSFFLLATFCFCICCSMTPEIVEKYEVKQYDIQGLENKVEVEKDAFGVFVLGIGYAESEENKIEKYYYFKVTEYGKQLESVNINDTQLYIKETNEKEPCLVHIYEKETVNNWFYKNFFGSSESKTLKAKQLIVPENTIKIEYNVDI